MSLNLTLDLTLSATLDTSPTLSYTLILNPTLTVLHPDSILIVSLTLILKSTLAHTLNPILVLTQTLTPCY